MSVIKLRKSWWVDFRFNGTRYRKRSPVNTRAGAAAWEFTLRQRLARGEPLFDEPRSASPTFADFAVRWYETYVVTNNKLTEQKSKRYKLQGHLVPFFGGLRLDDISTLHVEQFKALKVQQGLSPKTVNNLVGTLGRALRTAEEWQLTTVRAKLRKLKVPPQPFDFLSPEEADRLLGAADEGLWHDMILLALHTGLRIGELVGLHWSDIDLNNGRLTVRRTVDRGLASAPKNNRERHLPLSAVAWTTLQRRAGEHHGDRVVFGQVGDRYLSHMQPYHAMHRICTAADLRRIGWHTLRHTFASHLVAMGAPVRAVQELLGHADLTMTMRYAHLAPSALRSAVNLLDRPENSGQLVPNATTGPGAHVLTRTNANLESHDIKSKTRPCDLAVA